MTKEAILKQFKKEAFYCGYSKAAEIMRQKIRYQYKSGEITHDDFVEFTEAIISEKLRFDIECLKGVYHCI